MNLEDIYVGLEVKIKFESELDHALQSFERRTEGRIGVVKELDHGDVNLTVSVKFGDGLVDWGNHRDIIPIREEDILNKPLDKAKIRAKLVVVRRLLAEIEASL